MMQTLKPGQRYKLKSKRLSNVIRIHSKATNRGIKTQSLTTGRRVLNKLSAQKRQSWLILTKTNGRLSSNEIESARRTIRRITNKKRDFVTLRVRPFVPLTKKPAQSRMGRGKGGRSGELVCVVKPGQVLFEIETSIYSSSRLMRLIYLKAKTKLSIEISIVPLKRLLLS